MKLIVTAGDGFAANHIWPMWPQLLEQSTRDTRVVSLGKPAAGNEFIFNAVLQALEQQTPDLVIVQWAQSQRLDLIVDTVVKHSTALADPVYFRNLYTMGHNQWWLSNASGQFYVRNYHHHYIGPTQAQQRTRNYMQSLAAILTVQGVPYRFTSTYDTEFTPPDLDHWVWHEAGRGMEHYSRQERFAELRGTEVQPHTLVHAAWVQEILRPNLDFLDWREVSV